MMETCENCGHPIQLASGMKHWRHSDQGGMVHCIVDGKITDMIATRSA
jgi:hypothetical protein